MATLEKIRNKAALLVTAIGIALVAFIVGDLFTGGQAWWQQSQNKVVVINGERISYETFQKNVNDLTEIYKLQTGQGSLPSEYYQQINTQVYDNLVRETLVTEEADKLGMTVSVEELTDMVSGDNISPILQQMPFFRNQQTGEFDKNMLINFVNTVASIEDGAQGQMMSQDLLQARQFWMFWEKTIKKQRLEDKYTTLLSRAIMPNKLDINDNYEGGKVNTDFAYVRQSLRTVPDSIVNVSSAEVSALYNKIKDTRYKQGETRSVKYFYVDILPSEADYQDAEKEMNSMREEFATTTEIGDFVNLGSETPYIDAYVAVSNLGADERQFAESGIVSDVYGPYLENDEYKMFRLMGRMNGPDSIQARHIMISIQNEAQALTLADSLVNVLKNKKGNFAELAEQFSIDRNSAANGGNLGWFTEITALRNVGQVFKNACFEAKLKTYFTVRTDYGIHVVEVTDKSKDVLKANIAEYSISVTPSSRTIQSTYSRVNQFVANNNKLDLLEKNASENGFNLQSATRLATSDAVLGNIQNARQAVRWAFHAKIGSVSEIFEIDNKFLVVALAGETPAGYTPLAQVEPFLRNEIANEKKGAKIVDDLKAKGITSIDGYAKEMASSVDTAKFVNFNTSRIAGLGTEAVLSGLAPYVKENSLQGPVAGKNAVYVFNVYNKNTSEAPFNAEEEKRTLENTMTYRMQYQAMEVLKNRAKIEDNRVNFY